MRIKSFFAKSVDQAMAQARREMGEDALLLNTRKADVGYEVVFGIIAPETEAVDPQEFLPPVTLLNNPPPAAPVAISTAPPAFIPEFVQPEPAAVSSRTPQVSIELEQLRQQMDELRALIVSNTRHRALIGRSVPELGDVHARLMTMDVDAALAKDIVDRLESVMATDAFFAPLAPGEARGTNRWKSLRPDPRRLETFVRREMEQRILVDPRLGTPGTGGTIVVAIGPTGAGKTTSLVKLAVTLKKQSSEPRVRLLTIDTARPSGAVLLQSLAEPHGLVTQAVGSVDRLPEIAASAARNEIVLIDTPGYAGGDESGAARAASILRSIAGADIHLVVPGYMRAADLRRTFKRYQVFQPAKLLVTKLDETQSLGPIFSEAARSRLKLSFLADGPSIPSDLRAASIAEFVAMVLEKQTTVEQHVA